MGILRSVPRELGDVEIGSKSHSKRKMLVVLGYIRKNYKSAVDVDLVTYCIMNYASFYYDEWCEYEMKKENAFKVSYDNIMYISSWNMNDGYEWNSFGIEKIKKGQSKIWKIKVNHNPKFEYDDHEERDHTRFISRIGVIQDSVACRGKVYQSGGFGGGYFYIGMGRLDNNCSIVPELAPGTEWKEGDIITIELDLIKGTLTFLKNDKEYNMCFDNIDVNKTYTLVARMWFDEMLQICECI